MTRPAVSVVMPFAGERSQATAAQAALCALARADGDELILADNCGLAHPVDGIVLVRAEGERSPAAARNAGARHARCDWILFLDADVQAPADLLDRFFAAEIAADVGALAGAVVPAPGGGGLAERYGAARSFLDQDAHLAHPYLPRAVAANLLVRRVAFEAVGGFCEGVRAAEDTDFSWRLQRAGWRLEGRPEAVAEHRYRTSVRALCRQWRGYAAGRAWLALRYEDFEPEPALARAAARGLRRARRPARERSPTATRSPGSVAAGRLERGRFLALDALLGVEELAGLMLSNRPRGPRPALARAVLVADRFPTAGDPLADYARSLADVRVEASARPPQLDGAISGLTVDYREDDGVATRAVALARLLARHPLRCTRDLVGRGPQSPGLAAIAPAAARLRRDPDARLQPLGGDRERALADRLARLAGRSVRS